MVICFLKISLVLLAVASILCLEIVFKRRSQSSACGGHLLAKNLFGSACSGQYFMSEIELKRSKFCLQWLFVC